MYGLCLLLVFSGHSAPASAVFPYGFQNLFRSALLLWVNTWLFFLDTSTCPELCLGNRTNCFFGYNDLKTSWRFYYFLSRKEHFSFLRNFKISALSLSPWTSKSLPQLRSRAWKTPLHLLFDTCKYIRQVLNSFSSLLKLKIQKKTGGGKKETGWLRGPRDSLEGKMGYSLKFSPICTPVPIMPFG